MTPGQWLARLAILAGMACTLPLASAKEHGPGVTEHEVKIGQTMPYSGPASMYGTIGRAEAAYFRSINDQGGINGRKLVLISLDDAYLPPKTVEQTRKLIEEHQVLLIFSTFGTATNAAVQRYLNDRGVPQLFPVSGATRWGDPQRGISCRPGPLRKSPCSIRTMTSAKTT
jgi:branched-chain amino acid transport system substrate-binding protein